MCKHTLHTHTLLVLLLCRAPTKIQDYREDSISQVFSGTQGHRDTPPHSDMWSSAVWLLKKKLELVLLQGCSQHPDAPAPQTALRHARGRGVGTRFESSRCDHSPRPHHRPPVWAGPVGQVPFAPPHPAPEKNAGGAGTELSTCTDSPRACSRRDCG